MTYTSRAGKEIVGAGWNRSKYRALSALKHRLAVTCRSAPARRGTTVHSKSLPHRNKYRMSGSASAPCCHTRTRESVSTPLPLSSALVASGIPGDPTAKAASSADIQGSTSSETLPLRIAAESPGLALSKSLGARFPLSSQAQACLPTFPALAGGAVLGKSFRL